jgi:hypothetical protein
LALPDLHGEDFGRVNCSLTNSVMRSSWSGEQVRDEHQVDTASAMVTKPVEELVDHGRVVVSGL